MPSKPEDPNRRRVKALYVEDSRVLHFLAQSRFNAEGVTHIAMPWCLKLPKDIEVVGVWTDFMSQAFVFLLRSAEFEIVDECCQAPRIECEWEYLEAKVERPKPPSFSA